MVSRVLAPQERGRRLHIGPSGQFGCCLGRAEAPVRTTLPPSSLIFSTKQRSLGTLSTVLDAMKTELSFCSRSSPSSTGSFLFQWALLFMTSSIQPDALNRLRAEFDQVVAAYNSAISTGKLRSIRPAAQAAHHAVSSISQALQASHAEQSDFLAEVEAAFIDIRWGRAVARPA